MSSAAGHFFGFSFKRLQREAALVEYKNSQKYCADHGRQMNLERGSWDESYKCTEFDAVDGSVWGK
jgi:hypothetical protein